MRKGNPSKEHPPISDKLTAIFTPAPMSSTSSILAVNRSTELDGDNSSQADEVVVDPNKILDAYKTSDCKEEDKKKWRITVHQAVLDYPTDNSPMQKLLENSVASNLLLSPMVHGYAHKKPFLGFAKVFDLEYNSRDVKKQSPKETKGRVDEFCQAVVTFRKSLTLKMRVDQLVDYVYKRCTHY